MIEFYVDNYRIDMTRSRIIDQETIIPMEPKVLQVLLILAENQGQVVAHDVILNKVWPNSVIGANAIQRCIAQLRKAFGDDAKTQRVISTHPKVGYSLLSEVRWQAKTTKTHNQEETVDPSKRHTSVKSIFTAKHWAFVLAAVFLIIIVFAYQTMMPTNKLSITRMTSLTTTDNKELRPSYSPDGRYIAFERYISSCQNQLWAKDTKNNKEYLLTEEIGVYGTPIWSPDGTQIMFSSVTHCSKHHTFKGCEELRAVSFDLAKSSPQATREILNCKNKDFHSPVWLDNDNIAFISSEDGQDTLLSMSLTDNKIDTLYSVQNESLYSLDYSKHFNLLALSKSNSVNDFSLVLVNPTTNETTITPLQSKGHYNNFWHFSWHPYQKNLITSAGKSLYTLDLEGKLTEFNFPAIQNIFTPRYHPQGDNIVAAIGAFDPDIGELSWDSFEYATQVKNTITSQEIIARSTVEEIDAQYQPLGDHIAFISNREGSKQIWLLNLSKASEPPNQLSYFADDKALNSFVWSSDGKMIIASSNNGLTLLNLSGEQTHINMSFDVIDIFHTIGENQLLLKVRENNQYAIKLFDLNSRYWETLFKGPSQQALITEQGKLFVIDENFALYEIVDGSLLPVKDFQEDKFLSLFQAENNNILVADSSGKLWLLNIASASKSLYLTSEDYIGTISDILPSKKRLLFSKVVSVQKEIVVLK